MVIRIPRTSLPQNPQQPTLAPRPTNTAVRDIGNPVGTVAEASGSIASRAAAIYQKERDEQVRATLIDIDTDRRRTDDEIVGRYSVMQGREAVDARERTLAELEQNRKRVRASIKDGEVSKLWAQQDAALTNSAYSRIDDHYRNQSTRWQVDSLKERTELLESTVERVAFGEGYDPASGRLSREAERTRSAYFDSIKGLGERLGWSPEHIKNKQRAADARAHRKTVESLIASEQFQDAAKVMEANSDRFDASERRVLGSMIRKGQARADRVAQAGKRDAIAWKYANELHNSDATYEQKLAAIDQSVRTGRMDAETAEKSMRLMEHLSTQRYKATQRSRADMRDRLEQLFAKDDAASFDTLPPDTVEELDRLGMRADAFKIHRDVRANKIADRLATGDIDRIAIGRDANTVAEIRRINEYLLERVPSGSSKATGPDGRTRSVRTPEEEKRAQHLEGVIKANDDLIEALLTRPRSYVSQFDVPTAAPASKDGKAAPPVNDLQEVIRQMRQALYPGSGR